MTIRDAWEKNWPVAKIEIAVRRIAFYVFLSGVLVGVAAILSRPFPFNRPVWQTPVIGVSGFLNALLLMLISDRLKKISLPAVFAGLGVVLHEIIWILCGYFYLFSHHLAGEKEKIFALAALASACGLGALFIAALALVLRYVEGASRKLYRQLNLTPEYKTRLQRETLLVSIFVYAVLFGSIWVIRFVDINFVYAIFKWSSGAAIIFAMLGISQEVSYAIENIQDWWQGFFKVMTHIVVAASLTFLVYTNLPFEKIF